jgi:hypothetical protein
LEKCVNSTPESNAPAASHPPKPSAHKHFFIIGISVSTRVFVGSGGSWASGVGGMLLERCWGADWALLGACWGATDPTNPCQTLPDHTRLHETLPLHTRPHLTPPDLVKPCQTLPDPARPNTTVMSTAVWKSLVWPGGDGPTRRHRTLPDPSRFHQTLWLTLGVYPQRGGRVYTLSGKAQKQRNRALLPPRIDTESKQDRPRTTPA